MKHHPLPLGEPSMIMPTGTPTEPRTTATGSTGPALFDTGLTGTDTIWTEITVVISTATVFPSVMTGTMFQRQVRPPRELMNVDPTWSVAGSARAAGATPRKRCVPRRPRAWQVRSRWVGDENNAALVSMICSWVFGLRSCSPAHIRGAVEMSTKVRYCRRNVALGVTLLPAK